MQVHPFMAIIRSSGLLVWLQHAAKHSRDVHIAVQGDLIPWTIGQQFQDPDFPSLSGARIVRIAVHPGLNRAGYVFPALQERVC